MEQVLPGPNVEPANEFRDVAPLINGQRVDIAGSARLQ